MSKYFRKIGFKGIEDGVIFDIEAASIEKTLPASGPLYESWKYKMRNEGEMSEEELKKAFKEKAPLYAPFGKVVCVTMGYAKEGVLKTKSYTGEEKALITEFFADLTKLLGMGKKYLVGFSSVGYDMPFLAFRAMVNGVELHPMFDVAHQKEWNLDYCIDLNLYLRGTAFTNMSLVNAAVAFGLPSPKQSFSGSEVSELYWGSKKNKLDLISEYCALDVLTTANILCKVLNTPILTV